MKRTIVIALFCAVLAGVGGYFLGRRPATAASPSPAAHQHNGSADAAQYYRCPMHPWITSPQPSSCPICGMDLVAVTDDGAGGSGIRIDAATIQSMGITTETASRRTLSREIRMAGVIRPDERKVVSVTSKVMGYAEKVRVNATGEKVKTGETLFEMYSPDLVSGQEEFLRAHRVGDSTLAENARHRLLSLDIPEAVLVGLIQTGKSLRRLPFVSPASGVVTEKMIVEGQSVMPGMPLYTIIDLSDVWVIGEVYQNDLAFIAVGQRAEVVLDILPGKVLAGTVSLVYPELNAETRTAQVRIALKNTPELVLKPGMTAVVIVRSTAADSAVTIPEQAVIHSGRRDIVVVDIGNGRFEPREVVLGPSANGYVQILEGVREFERVVTSSQFLIDSESNLREAVKRLANMQTGDTLHSHPENFTPPPAVPPAAEQKTCPIMGGPINKKLFVDYKGKRIYVCCEMCLPEVKKDPEKAIKTLLDRGEKVSNAQKNH